MRRLLLLPGLLLLLAPAAFAAGDGKYKGETKGGVDLTLKVKKNKVVKFTTSVYATCPGGGMLTTVALPKGKKPKIKKGKFKLSYKPVKGVEQTNTIKGKFKGSKVSGTISLEGVCSEPKEKWSARR